MSALAKPPIITEEEYLAMADASAVKLEFIGGTIYAMAGRSLEHVAICQNLGRAFGPAVDARGCRGFGSDVRVKVNADGDFVYPESSYVCGEVRQEGVSLLNPTLIVEVLSPSTELYDRKGKMSLYRALSSVEEILLVASDEPFVERHRRHGDLWTYEEAQGLDASIPVLGHPVPLRDIYHLVDFPPRRPLPRDAI